MSQPERQALIDTLTEKYRKSLERAFNREPGTITEIEDAVLDLQREAGQDTGQATLDEQRDTEQLSKQGKWSHLRGLGANQAPF